MLHALIFAAVAFEILDRSENLGTEKPIPLRFECAVIDGLRFLDLTMRPIHDLFW